MCVVYGDDIRTGLPRMASPFGAMTVHGTVIFIESSLKFYELRYARDPVFVDDKEHVIPWNRVPGHRWRVDGQS